MLRYISIWISFFMILAVFITVGWHVSSTRRDILSAPPSYLRVGETYIYNGEPRRGNATHIEVYGTWKGLPVTEISANAFRDFKRLVSVTLPSTITVINDRAFQGCESLVSITIPNSVHTIGNRAFQDCTALEEIILPNALTRIDGWTFMNCVLLTEIIIPQNVSDIGIQAFANCIAIAFVTLRFDGVVRITANTFEGCDSLEEFLVPANVLSDYYTAPAELNWKSFADEWMIFPL